MASNTAPFEALQIIKESSYGTAKTTPVAGVDSIYIRLAGANRFTMRPKKTMRKVSFGGGFDIEGYRVSDQTGVPGNLQVELCYSQAQMLMDMCVTRINAGQTLPHVTTEPPGDLASYTCYHLVKRDDGTIKRRRYKGVKCSNWKLAASADTGLTMLSAGLLAQKYDGNPTDVTLDPDATAFPAPADTVFPTDPMLFVHTNGLVSLGGSALAYLQSIDVSVTNKMDPRFFATPFLVFNRLRGRESKIDAEVLYTASPDHRANYEALTTQAVSVAWTNVTHTVTFAFNGQNILDSVDDDLPPGKVYDQKISLANLYDTAVSEDIHFTYV